MLKLAYPRRYVVGLTTSALLIVATACGDGDGPTPNEVPATVSISPIEVTVESGKTAALQATVANADGNTIAGARVAWSTSSATIAGVNQSGVVTGAASGVARITATAGTISGSALTAVTTAVTTPQTVGPAGGTVSTPGGEVKVTLPNGALPAGGTVTITPITTGNAPGTTVPGTVYKIGVFGITVGPRPTITVRYSVEGLPAGFDERKLVLSRKVGVFWIPLPTVVDVTAKTMTATLPAASTASASFASASLARSLDAADEEFIVGAALFAFETSPTSIQLAVGDTRRLTGRVVTIGSGTPVSIGNPTASTSSAAIVALSGAPSITGTDVGVDIRGVATGAATITLGASTGSGANATPFAGTVNVTVGPPASLALTITGLPAATNAAVTVTGPGGFSQTATASRTFSAIATGTYTIVAQSVSVAGVTYTPSPANQTVVVNAGENKTATVAYSPPTGNLTVNIGGLPNGFNGAVNVTGAGGFARALTATTTIQSLPPGQYTVAATAVPGTGGTYNPAPASQSATVTAGQTATANITYSFVAAPCVSVDVTPTPITVTVGRTVQLSIIARDANRNALSGRTITLSSSNNQVMTASPSGIVTGVSIGAATLTITCESASTQFPVTVTSVPVASIVVTPTTFRGFIGDTIQLTASARDADGNPIAGKAITWSSTNANVASVGAGMVISRSPGNVTISASSEGKTGSSAGLLGCFISGTSVTCGNLNVAVQTPGSVITGQRTVVNGFGHLRCAFNITFVPTGGDAGTWVDDVESWNWGALEIRSGTNIPAVVDYFQDWQVNGQPAFPPFQINITWRYRINSTGQLRQIALPTVTCQ